MASHAVESADQVNKNQEIFFIKPSEYYLINVLLNFEYINYANKFMHFMNF